MSTQKTKKDQRPDQQPVFQGIVNQGRIVSSSKDHPCLDSVQLDVLEQAFRDWADSASRTNIFLARRRILLIFLLIRYTGAKLNEALALNAVKDIDIDKRVVYFHNDEDQGSNRRQVQLSAKLAVEIQAALAEYSARGSVPEFFKIDPGFVRRKFYERAKECGFSQKVGGPEKIRKARAVELMQGNMPLPAVQTLLGHSTPNLTSAYASFSEDEIQQMLKHYMERESLRKTSARNSFLGKIREILNGDIQSLVKLITVGGHTVSTVITNDSLESLGLKAGQLISAEIKAPLVILHRGDKEPACTAENKFYGRLDRIHKGKVTTEFIVIIGDGTELCAIASNQHSGNLTLKIGDHVWVYFNCFAVVLRVD